MKCVAVLAVLIAVTSAIDPRIFSAGSNLVLNSTEDVQINGKDVIVNSRLTYLAKDGSTMMDAQELDPRLTSLEGTTETHTEQLSLNAKTMTAQAARLDSLNATVTEHKLHTDDNTHSIETLTQRLDNADAELAKVLSPNDAGLEIHSGTEEGGHVHIFADEIDLHGAVQVLDDAGNLVNINNMPALVQQLRTEMNQVLEQLNGDVANMREELRDLRSRCDSAYEWEVMPHTATSDRVCKPLTECMAGAYEERPPSRTSDRVCGAHRTCPTGTYEAEHPTPFHDRVCKTWTTCKESEYEVLAPTAFEDRVCETATECDATTTYKLHVAGGEVICVLLRECTEFEDEIIAPTTTTDRICRVKQVTCTASQYESAPQSLTRPRVCEEYTICNPTTQYESQAATSTSDRTCLTATQCKVGEQYETGALTPTSDRVCNALTTCTSEEVESIAPTATSDRKCIKKLIDGCNSAAKFKVKINDNLWACMLGNEASKTWTELATACNLSGGWRLSSVRVMTHFGPPDMTKWKEARDYMVREAGSRYFVTGQAVRSCYWNSYQSNYGCNGLGYINVDRSDYDGANWGAATDGNFNELRDWPNAQVATGAFTLASLCYFGGQVPGVEDYANGYIWR